MRRLLATLLAVFAMSGAALADGPVPERRLAIVPNTDFPGNDIGQYFDTTFEACTAICLSDSICSGFTFNERSLACFPKSAMEDPAPFDGARSAQVLETAPRVLAEVPNRQAELDFLTAGDFTAARGLAEAIAARHWAGFWTPQQLINAANKARLENNRLTAFRLIGAALTLTDRAEHWLDYGVEARVIAASDPNLRREMRRNALNAATNAYLRAGSPQLRASAAFDLALALEADGRGRDMISALQLSLAQSPRQETEVELDRALATYGFRVTGQNVQAETAAPRICAIFSEDLADLGVDYRTYVGLPSENLAVTANGRQLCVSGVEHGARYRVQLRAGLPAANGETLRKGVEFALYVPDRSPSVRFAADA